MNNVNFVLLDFCLDKYLRYYILILVINYIINVNMHISSYKLFYYWFVRIVNLLVNRKIMLIN